MPAIIFLLVMLLVTPCHGFSAAIQAVIGSSAAVAASCTGATIQQSETGTDGSSDIVFQYSTSDWKAIEFSYSGTTGTLCRVVLSLYKTGSPTGTLAVSVYSDTGPSTSPNTEVSSCGTVDVSTLDTTEGDVTFDCADATISNGTTYWIVAYYNNPTGATNYPSWTTDSTCATEHVVTSADGSSWSDLGTTLCGYFKVYIKE